MTSHDLIYILPDLSRRFGWYVFVGTHVETWCLTKWGAKRYAQWLRDAQQEQA